MKRAAYIHGLLAVLLACAAARADFVDWTSPRTATAGSLALTVARLTDGPELSLSRYDLTTAPYLAFPGAGDQECLNFLCTDDWSASFNQPVTNLKLYAIAWRGVDGSDVSSTVQYTFTRSFSILSGFTGASISGNTLSLPGGTFYDGLLQFTGTFSALTVDSNATLENAQAVTFTAELIPEPTSTRAVLAIVFPLIARSTRARAALNAAPIEAAAPLRARPVPHGDRRRGGV